MELPRPPSGWEAACAIARGVGSYTGQVAPLLAAVQRLRRAVVQACKQDPSITGISRSGRSGAWLISTALRAQCAHEDKRVRMECVSALKAFVENASPVQLSDAASPVLCAVIIMYLHMPHSYR